jgi:hypothetical protein
MKSIHWKYQQRMMMSEEEDQGETEMKSKQRDSVTEAFTVLISELKKIQINNNQDQLSNSNVATSLIKELKKLKSNWTNKS